MKKPFISVCMPTYNRADSLKRALSSVLGQEFHDLEVIITDNDSLDDTANVVASFRDKRVCYVKHKKNIGMVPNWHSALSLASGIYAAFLFDDDEFAPNHVKEAYRVLKDHPEVGVYAVGNQTSKRPVTGFIKAPEYFRSIYSIKNVSTPSETIFKRTYQGKAYQINQQYVYCPEVALYLDIASDGFYAYHSPLQTVLRHGGETSASKKSRYTWIPFIDKFSIIERYKHHPYLQKNDYKNALKFNANLAFEKYVTGKLLGLESADEIFQGIKGALAKKLPLTYYKLLLLKALIASAISLRLINFERTKKIHHLLKRIQSSL